MDRDADVVVVGGGIIGSCAALSLQQAGKNTLLLDQYQLPHSLGSSGGQARIIHLSNERPALLTPILVDARKRWLEIGKRVNEELLKPMVSVVVGRVRENVEAITESMEKAGLHPIWIDVGEANKKYNTRFSTDYMVFEDRMAGVLCADRCLAAVMKLFRECGGGVEGGWKVDAVEAGDGWVSVRGPRGTVTAQHLLLCPGPWASQLLQPLGIHLPLQPIKSRGFFYTNTGLPQMCLVDYTDETDAVYFLPAMDSQHSIKTGHGGIAASPGEDPDMTTVGVGVEEYVRKYLPLGRKIREEDCWYTDTPDKQAILDRHPQHPNIIYGVGFSGRGFKMAPTIGHILACMVTGREHGFEVEGLGAERFAEGLKSRF